MLATLAAAIPSAVDTALRLASAEMQAFTPMLAILSARHEEQYSRLFRS
jgi:urease accessory protein